jgi:hypothetical protein
MVRRLIGAFALTCTLGVLVIPVAAGDPSRSLPMQFALRQEGPAAVCQDRCRNWVSVVGMIKPETAREFEAFAAKNDIRGATLVLDSEGGSVLGAMALGRAIRRLDMTTMVGRTRELSGGRAILSPRADCESMCAFVLLAGAQRIVPPEARVRVHQIWLGDRRDDANAAVYTAEDLVLVQRDIGRLAEYTIEMGGAVSLLEISLRIPPWEPMRILTREELRRMRLDTQAATERHSKLPATTSVAAVERAPASPPKAATVAAPAQAPRAIPASLRRAPDKNERGWAVIERAGAAVLARRHPLTVEGETIGSFEVLIGCGQAPNEYAVTYREARRQAGAAEPIRNVAVYVAQKLTPLTLGSSEFDAGKSERNVAATGVLPATALKYLSEGGNHSLTVTTSSAGTAATSTRIGNNGVAQSLPKLAAACAQQGRAEQTALVAPGK